MNWDGEIAINALGGFCIIIFVTSMVLALIALMATYGNFEYKTFNGETGYSDHCYVGRAGIFCSSDNGYVQVESYKDIKGGEE